MYNRVEEDEPPCSSDHLGPSLYFNDKEVQLQLHVFPSEWSDCSGFIGSHYKKNVSSVALFQNFRKAGLRILLFSGNVDAQVSYV